MRGLSCLLLCCLATLLHAVSATAAEPWWSMSSGSRPSVLPAEGEGPGEIVLSVENVGDAPASAGVRIVDSLPAGLQASEIVGAQPQAGGALGATRPLTCSLAQLRCETTGRLAPYAQIEVRIAVEALPGSHSGEVNTVTVAGGGAPVASAARGIALGAQTPFGVEGYGLSIEGEGGAKVSQAGSHPFQATGAISLTQGPDGPLSSGAEAEPVGAVRSVVAKLPPGMIANPGAVPRCLAWQFEKAANGGEQDECPYESAVGIASVTFHDAALGQTLTLPTPVFDIEPEAGEPARFGFFVPHVDAPVVLATSVRSEAGEDWGVDLVASEVPREAGLIGARVTFWGLPGSPTHDQVRGWGCLAEAQGETEPYEPCVRMEESDPAAFVTLPTSCEGRLQSSLEVDSWSAPGSFLAAGSSLPLAGIRECGSVAFGPTVSTVPTTHDAASPSGLALGLSFDISGLTDGKGVAQSDLKDTTVTLPEGMTIDPSAGVGLGACSPAQYAAVTLSSAPDVGCPEDSRLGTVEVETPLLFTTVYGSLYLATPHENPFAEPGYPDGSLIAVYVIARSRADRGILVKLAGKVSASPQTGQLTISFEGDPQLPFSRFSFHFKEGAQAPLITPATCGSYTTEAWLTPFSDPSKPLADSASFQITAGPGGAPCPVGPHAPFSPSIRVGALSNRAGVFSPFYVELSRTDDQQEVSSYSASLPLGVTADLTGVPFCHDVDITAARSATGSQELEDPSCPAESLIGHTVVGTGVGAVLDYVPGALYLAGPFHGDPFSVVSVTDAVIGPFDLGTIVIRFGLRIDPYTGQVSVDPTGSEPIPTIIDGIVTHVRDIKVSIDRPSFTLTPTSCASHPASSTMTSNRGQTVTVSTAFQEQACHELGFKPRLTASTQGKTSRRRGASISVKLTMSGKLGSESNIARVKVSLPKQLPAELKTLQQACPEAQFEADPAGCPTGSVVGHAKALTPILPVPLEGPAIFVSHGSAEYPSLVLVLQGYGVTIDLVGATHIDSHTGVISTTFKTVPDEPVSRFSLTLPEGKNPALAANKDLCEVRHTVHIRRRVTVWRHGRRRSVMRTVARQVTGTLTMPTTFVAQNGAKVSRETPVRVTGCARLEHRRASRRKGRRGAARRHKA